jgi:hypothetical protein
MSTDDSPKREFDGYDSEGLPTATMEHDSEGSTSNLEAIPNPSNPIKNPKPNRKPRREVWWLELFATNHTLESIGRCFEDRLNRYLLSSSNSLLRHVRSLKDYNLRQNLHQCPGYLREEITLSCDLSKSAIVTHAFPGPGERCSICHQLVEYTYSDSNVDHRRSSFLPDSHPTSTSGSSISGALGDSYDSHLMSIEADLRQNGMSSVAWDPALLNRRSFGPTNDSEDSQRPWYQGSWRQPLLLNRHSSYLPSLPQHNILPLPGLSNDDMDMKIGESIGFRPTDFTSGSALEGRRTRNECRGPWFL